MHTSPLEHWLNVHHCQPSVTLRGLESMAFILLTQHVWIVQILLTAL